jgi:hypothetical protein
VNNEAPELSAEARRIISAASGSDDPTPEDHDRVKARWLAGVAALAGVSSLTEAARAAGGIGWGLKAAGAALVLAAGAIGVYFTLPGASQPAGPDQEVASAPARRGVTHERFEKTPPGAVQAKPVALPSVRLPSIQPGSSEQPALAVPAPLVVAPVVEELPAPSGAASVVLPSKEVAGETAVVEEQPLRRSAAARKRTKAVRAAATKRPAQEPVQPEAAAAAAPSGQLGEELALLSQVRGSVQEGAPAQALELLSQYQARFGHPILGMEAAALRVDALCRSGQKEAARESARVFQNEWPGSPLGRRVSSACP